MSKDFTEQWEAEYWPEEDRTFFIFGKRFVARTVIDPADLAGYLDGMRRYFGQIDPNEEMISNEDFLALLDKTVLATLQEGHEEWKALRAEKPSRLALRHVREVVDFIFEVGGGRPFQQSSGSSNGSPPSGTPSTAAPASTEQVSGG